MISKKQGNLAISSVGLNCESKRRVSKKTGINLEGANLSCATMPDGIIHV